MQKTLEKTKAQAKAELEKAQRATDEITKERDELLATNEQLKNVNRE